MTRESKPPNEGAQTAEGGEKKGPVDEAIEKARELGLVDKANELVEKAINRLSGKR